MNNEIYVHCALTCKSICKPVQLCPYLVTECVRVCVHSWAQLLNSGNVAKLYVDVHHQITGKSNRMLNWL